MPLRLIITLIISSVLLFGLTTYILRKGRISVKYSLLWYFMAICILLIACIPNIFVSISNLLGFETVSSLIVAMLIGILIILTLALTVICSGQRQKITLLMQELSILKKRFDDEK